MADRIIIPKLEPDQNAALQRIFQRYEDRLAALERGSGHAGVIERDYSAKAGEFLNIEAPSAGLTITLPKSTQQLRNARVVMAFRTENPVRIVAALGLVNREAFVINTAIGTFEAICDGIGGWSVLTGVTSSGSPTDARYVLGAAHGSLPNAAVGTDTAEVDFSFTPGGVATWVLNVASVAFSKLANLAGLSVLGRAANSTGVMAAITSTAARQVLRNVDAGTSLAFGFPIEAQLDDVDIGDIHTLNVEVGRFTVASGIGTLEKPTTVIDSQTGTLNAYTLPATLRHGDTLALLASTSAGITLNGINQTGVPTGFEFILSYSDSGAGDGRTLVINDESGSATALDRLSLPADLQMVNPTGVSFIIRRASTRWLVVDRSVIHVQDDGVLQTAPVRIVNALSTTSNVATATVASGVASLSYQRAALTGDVTAAHNGNATTIANDAVTDAKLRNSGALSVIGRSANSSGDPADISATAASGAVLRESGSTLGFGTIAAAGLTDAIITPTKLAIFGTPTNTGVPFIIYVSFAAGGGGAADDVTVFNANAPFAFRILEAWLVTATAVVAATVQARSASGGGGSALTTAMLAAVTGKTSDNSTATTTVAASGSVFLRRSDSGVAGEFIILAVRT